MTTWYFSSGVAHVRYPYRSPLDKMGGLQYGEGSTKFILEGIGGFGTYYTRDFWYGIFLGNEYFVCPILGQFYDILASLLMEMCVCVDSLIGARRLCQ
jgi:hypothetical protein